MWIVHKLAKVYPLSLSTFVCIRHYSLYNHLQNRMVFYFRWNLKTICLIATMTLLTTALVNAGA